MPALISISSHVARGHVGNCVAVFALQRLGFTVWHVPTVLLPHHPGHGAGTRIETPAKALGELLDDLATRSDLSQVDGILTGYLGSADQVEPVARFIRTVKSARPDAVYCCDPVMGDDQSLYVAPELAKGIRDVLLPLADMATPNLFELGWLAGQSDDKAPSALADAARSLGPAEIAVTSAPAMMRGNTAVLHVTETSTQMAEAIATQHPPHGLGDLFAALLLAHRVADMSKENRLRRAVASVHDLAIQTGKRGLEEIPLAEEQHRLLQSSMVVQMRRLQSTRPKLVIGVDGCPDGWLAVAMPPDNPAGARLSFHADFASLLAAFPTALKISVDMPIGLPERLEGRGRRCEVLARQRLAGRQSSVFAIPARGAVMETDYRTACDIALQQSDPPRKISKQAFMLFPKIRDIDAAWQSGMETRIYETHPELAFWALNGGTAMSLPKKIKGRPNPAGLAERAEALKRAGFEQVFLETGSVDKLPGPARRDDLLDACVCAWSAARIHRGEALSFPDPADRDDRGRPMAITV